ncbi:FAD/NAD(P)-binding domain-containing protein [Tothia fuscella]|uniref:FAD/NAD(P)-binding domain-containing protein n=1 Tax=Tothia fuscella TaxID=1048955 RepID=A0A9P4NYR5_9PEZI|nr:FAD/NAD(P)-binding domain-containing protein [Tothia fuscella]
MSAPPLKVLISGGGIAGGCLAFWLSKIRQNVHVTLIERAPTPRVTGQAIDIRGPAVKVIQRMGLEEAIRAKFTRELGTTFIDTNGKVIADFPAQGNKGATSEFEILRADLANIFLDATKNESNIEQVFGQSIKTLTQDESKVHITYTGDRPAESFDLVVGADGSSSKTRSLAFDELEINPYKPLGMYVAFFSIPSRPDDKRLWLWHTAAKGRAVMTRPHNNPSTLGAYLCLTMPTRDTPDPELEEARKEGDDVVKAVLHKRFEGVGWQAKRLLEGMDDSKDFYFTMWNQIFQPKLNNGRVALVGDAGNATPGEGTSLAIRGAYILAGEISKIQSSNEIPAALESYEKIIRPVVKEAQQLPSVFPQLANPQTAWGLSLLNTVIWTAYKTRLTSVAAWFQKDEKEPELELDYKWEKL